MVSNATIGKILDMVEQLKKEIDDLHQLVLSKTKFADLG